MREELFAESGFVCPRCRRAEAGAIEQAPLGIRKGFRAERGFMLQGLLECSNPACGATYPVVDGVPVVLRDVGSWWRRARTALPCAPTVAPRLCDYFNSLRQEGAAEIDARSLLGSYMDFHYGEFADRPGPKGPVTGSPNETYWEKLAATARPDAGGPPPRSIDLGCSVGRYAFEMGRFSGLVVGLDVDFGKVAAAARIQRGQAVAYERRERGLVFRRVQGSFDPPQNVLFAVGDALDPPFPADSFDLVGALNLLDNVSVPLVLLGQIDALLRTGGIVVLGTPYEWRTEIADAAEWLETDDFDAPALLRRVLTGATGGRAGFRYAVEREIEEVPWVLRGHARRRTFFLSHVIRARKEGGAPCRRSDA